MKNTNYITIKLAVYEYNINHSVIDYAWGDEIFMFDLSSFFPTFIKMNK